MNFATTLKQILQGVKKNTALIESHIASRGNAHAIATFEQNGFMSADDKNQLTMRGRNAITVSDGYDVMSILAGLYIGRNFKNAPSSVDDSVCIVQVTGNSSFKKIEFDWINGHRNFYRFIYNGTDSGWINDGKWVSVTPLNGASGYITVNRLLTGSYFELALRIDINISLSSKAPVQIGTLPVGYTTTDSNADYFSIIGVDSAGSNVPMGLVVTGGNTISIFRIDSSTSAIAKARGYVKITCQDSQSS
ncbi:MAG: hypothetical protein ABF624_00405 [Liquorilactobacillus ghanensis]|uniref:hypothetical protein n=1 Tax=Liquorilactobacillus ghanensis TaxID=399370 RepID=UPI0039E8A248